MNILKNTLLFTILAPFGLLPAAETLSPLHWEERTWNTGMRVNSVDVIPAYEDATSRLVLAAGAQRVWLIDPSSPETDAKVILDTKDGRIMHVKAVDANADGFVDLAIGRFSNPWVNHRAAENKGEAGTPPQGPDFTIGWLENPGSRDGQWLLHALDNELNQTHGVWVGELDGKEGVDIVANSVGQSDLAGGLYLYSGPFRAEDEVNSTRKTISKNQARGRAHYFDAFDVDPDGRMDILMTASGSGELNVWSPNDSFNDWDKKLLMKKPGLTNVTHGNLNLISDKDIIFSNGHGVGIFGLMAPAYVEEVIIDDHVKDVHALAAGDFTGNTLSDVAAVSFTEKTVGWYENLGDGTFRKHQIDLGRNQEAYDLRAEDINADGRIDLLIAGRQSRNVVVLLNLKNSNQ